MAVEQACLRCEPKEAELRAESRQTLKQSCIHKCSISKEGQKALKELKQEKTHVILTVDKGVSLAVLHKDITSRRLKPVRKSGHHVEPLQLTKSTGERIH